MILLRLFLSFLQIGLFSIGGGYAAIPLIQDQVVETFGWLTMDEFTDLVTIAEMTPGPIAVNSATFVGIRIAGPWGALIATLGVILPSMVIVSIFALIYHKLRGNRYFDLVLAALRPAVVALIAGAGLSILLNVLFSSRGIALSNINWLSAVLFAGALTVLRKFKLNPILIMLATGVISMLLTLLINGLPA